MAIIGLLAAALSLIFWLSGVPRLRRFFEFTPPVIYAYFVPMLATTLGITPPQSPAYDWMVRYLLPLSLLLLMISVDLKAIARLGTTAVIMILAGTAGSCWVHRSSFCCSKPGYRKTHGWV